jgi:ABC-type multidrug transport system fused ATPase/permease subunit
VCLFSYNYIAVLQITTRLKKRITDIKRILNISERRRFVVLILLNVLLSIADIGSIALVFVVLNIYSGKPVTWILPILDQLNIHQQSFAPAIFLILIFILKSTAGYFITKAQFRYISDVASRLTEKNLLLYLEGSYENYVNVDSAVWTRRICFQTLEFAQYVLSGIQQVINESVLVIISVTALALYNIRLLLIVSLVLLPAIIILSYVTKKRLRETRNNIQAANTQSLQYLNEAVSGFVESNIYDANDFFIKRYSQSRFVLNRFIADMLVTQAIPNRFFETFAVLGIFILMAAMHFGGEGTASIFMLGAFVAAAYKIIPGISRIINFTGQIKTYLFTSTELACEKIIEVKKESASFSEDIQKIEMRHVQFSYADTLVFNNLNFIICKNSFVGISGNSGKGKTTLIDLLIGFLRPHSGAIFFNEKNLQLNDIKKFWRQIAYVKQTAFLLHDTILNNITLYKNGVDEKKVDNILAITGLSNWIQQLPDGIQTMITESGKNISGGQRQRIAIARSLYKDASLIILDEPFNELDEASEINLLNYFKQLSRNGKTILLVTHNTDSLKLCDQVIYLNEQS